MRSRLGFLPFLAAAVAAPAASQTASESCGGATAMPTEPGVTVIRTGSGHQATIVRSPEAGTLHFEQHGQDHAALAVQSGSDERLVIDQRGVSAEAEVTQAGTCNATELSQSGTGNRATVIQSGSNNRAVVHQTPGQE